MMSFAQCIQELATNGLVPSELARNAEIDNRRPLKIANGRGR